MRTPRVESSGYLKFVRQLPCLITGRHGVDAAHVRYSSLRYAKRQTGMAEKPDDRWAVPLEHNRHLYEQHNMDERAFWKGWNIDPLQVSSELHSIFGMQIGMEERVMRGTRICTQATNGNFPFFDEF